MSSNSDETNAIIAFIDSSIDQIIEWAEIDPDKVIGEFRARGIRMVNGELPSTVADLADVPTRDVDNISRKYISTYSRMAAGQGFVTGLGGLITLPATVPADAAAYVGWLARCASAVQVAHGFDTRTDLGDAELKLGLLAGGGVSTLTVKGSEILVTQLAKKVASTPYAKAPVQAAVKALAAKVGVQLTHKSFAKTVPGLGGVINGTVHGAMVRTGGKGILTHYGEVGSYKESVKTGG